MFDFIHRKANWQLSETVIGKTTVFRGEISGQDKVTIYGMVEDEIDIINDVVIDKEGKVDGVLIANNAMIAGEFRGIADVRLVFKLLETAHVQCDLKAYEIITDKGAFFSGNFERHPDMNVAASEL